MARCLPVVHFWLAWLAWSLWPGAALGAREGEEGEQAAQVRFFPEYDLDSCRLLRAAGRGVLEFCAVSAVGLERAPGQRQRRFLLTFRDPTRMEKNKSAEARAVLVSSAVVKTDPGEYLDYKKVTLSELVDGNHLIFAPIVKGVPDRYKEARALLYVFNDQTLKAVVFWTSPPCPAPCRDQQIRLAPGKAEGEIAIEYTQIIGEAQKSTRATTSVTWRP